MMIDKVSIVMPVYNSASFLDSTIKSVLLQQYENWELILVDDGSTDESLSIITKYSQNDFRIKVFSNDKNMGVSFTRNYGVVKASANHIAFLDSDDIWEKNKLTKQITKMNEKLSQFSYTGSKFINEEGIPISGITHAKEVTTFNVLRKSNIIPCSSVILEKNLYLKYNMSRDDLHEDYLLWLKILKSGTNALGIDEPLLIYRMRKNSRSSQKIKTIRKLYKVHYIITQNFLSSILYTAINMFYGLVKYARIGKEKK